MRTSKLLFALTTIGGLAATSDSRVEAAGSATANLQITAAVNANCTITTAAVAFSPYDPIVAHATLNDDGTGSLVVTCTKGAVITIGLGPGNNNLLGVRHMKAVDTLDYELYSESTHTTVWGTGAAVYTPAAAPSKAPRTFTVYGRIPPGQDVAPGSYTDTVVATVNF